MSKPKHPAWSAAEDFSKDAGLPMPGKAPPAAPPAAQPPAPSPARAAAPPPTPAAPTLSAAEVADLQARLDREAVLREELESAAIAERSQIDARIEAARSETSTALTKQIEALQRQIAESDAKLQKREVDEMFDLKTLVDSEHLSQDAARELVDRVLKPVVNTLRSRQAAETEALRGNLREVQESVTRQVGELTEAQQRAARRLVNEKILHAHSDFTKLRDSREWKEFMGRPIPGSRRTFGEEISAAYSEGDSDYVVGAIGTFKDGKPRVTDVADVDSSRTVAHQPAADKDETKFAYSDLTDWRYQMQRGEITKEQYRKNVEAFKTAEKQGRVR